MQNEVLVFVGLRSCSMVSGPRLMCSWAECSLHAYINNFFRCRDSAWLVFVASSIDPPCHFLWWIQPRCELPLRHNLLSPTPVFLCICLSPRLLHLRTKVILVLSLQSLQFAWGPTAHCYFPSYGRHACNIISIICVSLSHFHNICHYVPIFL